MWQTSILYFTGKKEDSFFHYPLIYPWFYLLHKYSLQKLRWNYSRSYTTWSLSGELNDATVTDNDALGDTLNSHLGWAV